MERRQRLKKKITHKKGTTAPTDRQTDYYIQSPMADGQYILCILSGGKLPYDPVCPSVGRSVCHNFLRGGSLTLLPIGELV